MSESMDPRGLSRRELLFGAVLLVGGAPAVLPTDLFAAEATTKRYFDKARFEVLDAVCEIIIPATDTPGAHGAGVPVAFDALMQNWASSQRRQEFSDLLDAIDAAAVAQAGKKVLELSAATQIDVMTKFDAARFRKDAIYSKFKELVVRLYYLSEVGATQELRLEMIPGAWEPALKITPTTRAWATPE